MTFPLPDQPTWKILDSTKIDEYILCPRKFFYSYVLGWRMDVPAQDLIFGAAWHKAREHQLINGYFSIKGAMEAFMAEYRAHLPAETDALYVPKTPTAALNGLIELMGERPRDLIENELVIIDGVPMTEISGTVPIDENRLIHYRMDSIMRRKSNGKIFSWDHKTTSGKWIHDTRWDDELYLSIQNGTYTHCLYCMYPVEQVDGVEFLKTGFEFLERSSKNRSAGYHATTRAIPAFKTPDQMNTWLWTINTIVDEIERDMDRLMHCQEGDPVMMAFRQNPKSCTAYKGCPFHDFCMSWQNPLQRCHQPPLGYRVEWWNPSEVKTSVKKDLKWGGV